MSRFASRRLVVAIVLLKVLITFGLLLVAVLLMIWFERKVHADMSNRLGPNRAGPFGILQTLADGIKFFFKEDLIPDRADRIVFMDGGRIVEDSPKEEFFSAPRSGRAREFLDRIIH